MEQLLDKQTIIQKYKRAVSLYKLSGIYTDDNSKYINLHKRLEDVFKDIKKFTRTSDDSNTNVGLYLNGIIIFGTSIDNVCMYYNKNMSITFIYSEFLNKMMTPDLKDESLYCIINYYITTIFSTNSNHIRESDGSIDMFGELEKYKEVPR